MPGPYSITGLVLFNKTSFANVLSTDQVVLSPTNIFAGLFADVAPAAGDTSGIRWVVEDGTNFFISTASTGLASATNPSSISQNPTSLAWYGYDPLTDITAIGAMVAPGFTNINYVGFRLEGTSATNTTSTLGIAATQLRFDVTVAVPVPARLVPLPLDQTRLTDGMLDVTKSPYFADNSGATDAHLAIQNAINDAYAANLIVFFPGHLSLHGRFVLHSNSRSCLARPAQICQQVGRFDPGPATGAETCRWRGRDQYHRSGRRAFATGLPGLCPVFVGGRRGQFRDPRRPGIAILLHVPGNRY